MSTDDISQDRERGCRIKVIQIFPGGAGVVDKDQGHKIEIDGEAINEVPDTPQNREKYLKIPVKETLANLKKEKNGKIRIR